MKNAKYSLRRVTKDDLDLILHWRNLPQVRRFMYTSVAILREHHEKWFLSMLVDSSKRWLVLSIDDRECAVIYYTSINFDVSCSWGFYSGPSAPRGVSLIVELAALEYVFDKLQINRLHCEVLSGNHQVINLHTKAGFTREGYLRQACQTPRGIEDIVIFGMLRDEWPTARDLMLKRLSKLF